MKRLFFLLSFVVAACARAPVTTPHATAPELAASFAASGAASGAATCTIEGKTYPRGFNEFGYNYCARNFVGAFGGWCAARGLGWNCAAAPGYMPYANDHLVMKWNAEWDRGNAEGWTKSPYAAREDNEWNGMRPDGSKVTEHVKIVWVGACGADGTVLPDGGYCIWGIFEAVMDQGMSDGERYVLAHALPNGYGAPR